MGMFQWTWGRGANIDYEEPVGDLNTGKTMFPDSRLGKFINWCDANNLPYESCLSQLEFLWAVDMDDQAWGASSYCGLAGWNYLYAPAIGIDCFCGGTSVCHGSKDERRPGFNHLAYGTDCC